MTSIENFAEVSLRIDLQFLARRAQTLQNGRRRPPLSLPANNQFFLPSGNGFELARSHRRFQFKIPGLRGRFIAAR